MKPKLIIFLAFELSCIGFCISSIEYYTISYINSFLNHMKFISATFFLSHALAKIYANSRKHSKSEIKVLTLYRMLNIQLKF